MLKTWGLTNFKSIYKADLELAPLTILTGTNSSGKSAFIQSILLIAQTLRSYSVGKSLILNGDLVDIGHFDDILSYNISNNGKRKYDPLGISFTCEHASKPYLFIDDNITRTYFNLVFDSFRKMKTNNIKNIANMVEHSRYHLEQQSPCLKSVDNKIDIIDNLGNITNVKRYSNKNIVYQHESQNQYKANIYLKHFWPLMNLSTGVSDCFNNDDYPWYNAFSFHFDFMLNYLGPLRYHSPLYPFTKVYGYNKIGLKGEYTACILDTHYDIPVKYIPVKCLNETGLEKAIYVKPLNDALKYWLNYLGVADDVKSKPNKFGYELETVINKKININLSHVGTGVSQVLPILVSCLLADKGSTLIFEQPELHLHPRVQSRLADFFISMMLVGKQCIIETHSEYLIDKLRLRISQSLLNDDSEIKNNTNIYFFDKHENKTIINKIEVNEYADYDIWPDSFFDERQYINEEILNSINNKIFNTENNDLDDENMEDVQLYEEDIEIAGMGVLRYLLFNDINKILKDYLNQIGINKISFIKKVEWILDRKLSENVKNAMNKYNVNYSITIYVENNVEITVIYKREENEWYSYESSRELTEDEKNNNAEVSND